MPLISLAPPILSRRSSSPDAAASADNVPYALAAAAVDRNARNAPHAIELAQKRHTACDAGVPPSIPVVAHTAAAAGP